MAGTQGLVISEYSYKWPTFKYAFPFSYTILNNIALRYRKPRLFSYIYCAVFPLVELWYDFLQYRDQTLRELKVNSTTIILEGYLRDYFNIDGIYIINTPIAGIPTFLYNKGEKGDISNDNTNLYNQSEAPADNLKTYLFNKSEIVGAFNFIVRVPISLIAQGVTIQQIRALIDPYVKLGKKYDIVLY